MNDTSAGQQRPPRLVAGRHRVAAAKRLGWAEIEARFLPDRASGPLALIDAQLAEIAKKLHRRDLDVLERSEQLARWIVLTEERQQLQAAQVAPHRKAGQQPGGINAAVRELGVDRSKAQRAVKVAELAPETKAAARKLGLVDNLSALLAAAKEPDPKAQVAALQGRAPPTREADPVDPVRAGVGRLRRA